MRAFVAALVLETVVALELRKPQNLSSDVVQTEMDITPHQFMKVELGPFPDAVVACNYCKSSFTKMGQEHTDPVAPACTCMAHKEETGGQYKMFCATPPSAAGFVDKKGGCLCKYDDRQNLGATTCAPIAA